MRPELLADGFDHFDGDDAIVLAALIAIVLESDLDFIVEAGILNALSGKIALLLADRQADDANIVILRREFGKAAPTAADFEQVLPGSQVDGFSQAAKLVVLSRGQIVRFIFI